MTQEYLSLKKAAEEFSVSVRTLYRMREQKKLFFHKLGGRTLIRKPELEILIYKQEI
jgi:excisionase family DNA binding protein